MTSKITFILFVFCCLISHAQTLKGKVIDAATKQPLETVSVYFDNTTIGTTTNENGEFSIDYNDAVQSTLVISFLGYEKYYDLDYRQKENIIVELKESIAELDEVVIDANDGMSRAQKLRWFRKEFLGKSEFGKSCKILNEKDLRFRYNKRNRTLMAWSNKPVLVQNKSLKYQISFDIVDFEIVIGNWNAQSVIYSGTTFFKDLESKGKKKTLKNREKAYRGSVQHFMRALYSKSFEKEGYVFGVRGFVVKPFDFFTISEASESGVKTVTLKKKLDIFYEDYSESVIKTAGDSEFRVDKFGNYEAIPNVLFGGDMGSQRVGDMLPLDYNFDKDEDTKVKVITKDFIQGIWRVISVEKEPTEKPYNLLIDSFKAAKFQFNSDKSVKLESTVPNSLFSIMTSVLNSANWSLIEIEGNSYIDIGSNSTSQMKIQISINNKKDVLFTIENKEKTPVIVLKMEKI